MATSNFGFEGKAILGLESTHPEIRVAPMTNRVNVYNFFLGLLMATSNFAFEIKDILGLESTHLESRVAKIGLNVPP